MIFLLLAFVILLLLVIVALLVTRWPGREREVIERYGSELRREMAELRAETIQTLHAMRMGLDDGVREAIEKELGGLSGKLSQFQPSSGRPAVRPLEAGSEVERGIGQDSSDKVAERGKAGRTGAEESRQLTLFMDFAPGGDSLPLPVQEDATDATDEEDGMIRVYAADDLPDV